MSNIAILTNFMDFNPSYSLTGIVTDQIVMLLKHKHHVHLFVNSSPNQNQMAELEDLYPGLQIHSKIPFAHLIDYVSQKDITEDHHKIIDETVEVLIKELTKLNINYVYTHDFVFSGWFSIYGIACQKASPKLPQIRWLHWIHSVPTGNKDWWEMKKYGKTHKLIFPNKTDAILVAEQYKGVLEDVRVIPHIKDLRTWADFHPDTIRFLDMVPEIMQADVVQILPAGSDRLDAKRVDVVMKIFSNIKKLGYTVCLVCANQWMVGRDRNTTKAPEYDQLASELNLSAREFLFTSDMGDKVWVNGLHKRMLRELMMCQNLFIFPTKEESFGLVVPETSLSSGCLQVLNKSLKMQIEISGNHALYFDFGSNQQNHSLDDPDKYYRDLALIIIGRMKQDESLQTRTFYRKHNNYDYLYNQYYGPIMMEAMTWV